MRILTLTNLYPNPYQPHRATFNRQQVRLLARRHAVRVIAPVLWTDELWARWKRRPPLPTGRRVELDGLEVEHPRYYYPPRVGRGWYGRCFRWSVRDAFRRAAAEFKPDLVYAPWAYPDGWAAVALGREAGVPVVIKVHGSDVLMLSRYPRRVRGTREALRGADHVVAVSRDLADKVAGCGVDPGRVTVVYDGIDASVFRPGDRDAARARLGMPGGDPLVLFVGNLVPVKGIDVLVEACARLAAAGVRFDCRIIGQGPLRARLEALTRARGVRDRVRFLGPMPHHTLPDWYRAAAVFVLPSHSEGVPNVLLETAACGTAFVASRVGGIPEIARHAPSALTPPGDPAALADAIRTFLGPEGASGGGHPPVRTVEETVEELGALFERVAGNAGRPAGGAAPPRGRGVVGAVNGTVAHGDPSDGG